MIFRIETELNFSNCQWILIHRLSIVIDAENLTNLSQFAHLGPLAPFLDRVGFPGPLGAARYHTFVNVEVLWCCGAEACAAGVLRRAAAAECGGFGS